MEITVTHMEPRSGGRRLATQLGLNVGRQLYSFLVRRCWFVSFEVVGDNCCCARVRVCWVSCDPISHADVPTGLPGMIQS